MLRDINAYERENILMPIYTPGGLRVRLSLNYAFGLIARLFPKVDAFRILKTTEGIESLPTLLALVIGLVCFITHVQPVSTGIAVFVAYIAGAIINLPGLYFIPSLVSIATLYSYVSGFGIFLIGLFLADWKTVLAFFLGKFFGWAINQVLELWDTKRAYRLSGQPFTASEKFFLNAYRLHASRLGVSTNIELTDDELKEGNWAPAFLDFEGKWPKVAARFTQE